MRKLILYIAASLDGFIADKENKLDWLTVYTGEYGYTEFMKSVDTVLMGRKTYEWVTAEGVTHPHPEQTNYIFTSTPEKFTSTEHIIFTSHSPLSVVEDLKGNNGRNIFLVGGGGLISNFVENNLIDEYILFVVPVLLGSGIPLFHRMPRTVHLETMSVRRHDDGMIELRLKRIP